MGLGATGREAAAALGLPADLVREPRGAMPWASRLPTATLASDAVAVASLAVNALAAERFGGDPAPVVVDRPTVAASFGSEEVLRIDGQPPSVWAPLSGFWRTADGWVRTHANYPHHERALRELLGLADDADPAPAVAAWRAIDLESAAAERGAIVGAVRSAEEWRRHPQAAVVAAAPLLTRTRVADAAPRPWRGDPHPGGDPRPLGGVRVLDLTRVLAGPIAARDLALAGADVLRVDSPALPETGWIHLDTGQGKRSTLLDLRDAADRARFEALLSGADVVLTGYRPGALARFGLDPAELAARHPGLVTGSVSAWGHDGPWAGRRGFDSIVQAVTGIALAEGGDAPGALPAQALDHATGHLLAAAVIGALAAQRATGGSHDVRVSLARTAHALLTSPDAITPPDAVALPVRERMLSGAAIRALRYAPPALAFAGAPEDYADVGRPWGADPPAWPA